MSEFDNNKPYWWSVAETLVGTHEKQGNNQENPRILDMYAVCGSPQKHDETAWCAAFVGACLELSGFQSTNSLLAVSYKSFGKELQQPVKGCIVVFHRMTSNQANTGHVGFYSHTSDDGRIFCLGGNQGDTVSVAGFPRRFLRSYRWPTQTGELPQPLPKNLLSIDAITNDFPPHLTQDIVTGGEGETVVESIWRGETGGFKDCMPLIFAYEGGFVNHPDDPGGATNMGITIDTLRAYRKKSVSVLDVQQLTKQEAGEIFRQKYWNVNSCDSLPKPLALLTFNASVLFGPHRGAEFLQTALNKQGAKLLIDGDIGPQTIAAAQRVLIKQAVDDFVALQRALHEASKNKVFLKGWLNRMAQIEVAAENFIPPLKTTETKIAEKLIIPTPIAPIAPIKEEPIMAENITLTQTELANIIEVAVKEAVRKSAEAHVDVVTTDKPLSAQDVQAMITNAMKTNAATVISTQEKITTNGLAPTVVTAIDRVLGGEMLAGKKTLIAVAAAAINAVLAKMGYVSANTSDIVNILAAGLGAAGVLSKIDRATEARVLVK
jgi:uncharacterized protein (TIGR02594 family)